MSECLMCLRIQAQAYDLMAELLLSYPERELNFVAKPLQIHHAELSTMSEKVSGFQNGYELQIKTNMQEAQQIDAYLQNTSHVQYELMLRPLLSVTWR